MKSGVIVMRKIVDKFGQIYGVSHVEESRVVGWVR